MTLKTTINKSDITQGKAKSYKFGDEKIVICNVGGKFFALSNICTHDDGELVSSEGPVIEDCQLECPRHGARFDVKTGEVKRMPAVLPIKTYIVVDKGEELEIEGLED